MSDAPDKVLVVIARTRHKMIQAELQAAAERGAKFIELRLDYLAKAVEFKRLLPFKTCPWVATLRRPADGGRWAGTEPERLAVLRQAIASGAFDWVDLEADIADAIPRFGSVKRIVSYHNLTETPADLEGIYDRMCGQTADVVKVAVMAQGPDDIRRVLDIQKAAAKPTVAFAMGDLGFPTRILALKYGAPWTYAAFNRERGVAPGLPAFDDFRTTYPVRAVGPDTKVFGLLGDPVGHSLSPVLHNHMFPPARGGRRVRPGPGAEGAPRGRGGGPGRGAGGRVQRDHPAQGGGGRTGRGRGRPGGPTDRGGEHPGPPAGRDVRRVQHGPGGRRGLARRPPPGAAGHRRPAARVAAVVSSWCSGPGGWPGPSPTGSSGPGPTSRSPARSADAAGRLAAEVGCKVVDWEARHNVVCDVVVNATPVGMAPDVAESPVHHSFLKPGMTVFDTVYTPESTMLVREARARGCHVVTGVGHVSSGRRPGSSSCFTGITPPLDQMRALVRKATSAVRGALDDETAVGES